MSARLVRLLVMVVCAGGIAGMVVGSIADDNAVGLTFGLITAGAVLCLVVATAVAPAAVGDADETVGMRVEERVAALVAAGADEGAVRALVQDAVTLGRGAAPRNQGREGSAGAGVHGGRTPRPDGRTFT
jgi:ABC-type Na+ efflux pump permease subunit